MYIPDSSVLNIAREASYHDLTRADIERPETVSLITLRLTVDLEVSYMTL